MEFQKLQCLGSFKEAIFEAGNIIRDVSLLGAESKNRRRYDKQGMIKAVPLYNGVKCFINHQTGPEGNVMDLAGRFINPRFEDMRIKADFEALPDDPAGLKVVRIAKSMPEIAGFSHNAAGKIRVEDGVEVVESIEAVHSCDLVAYPASNKSIFESLRDLQGGSDMSKRDEEFVEMLKDPDLRRGMRAVDIPEPLPEDFEFVTSDIGLLRPSILLFG